MGHPFKFTVFLSDATGAMKTGLPDLPITVSLFLAPLGGGGGDGGGGDGPALLPAKEGMLVVDVPPAIVNGRAELCCHFTDVSMNISNRNVVIKVTGKGAAPAFSQPVHIVKHRLESNFSSTVLWADEWLKDVGGKRNHMKFPVKLVDASGGTVLGREVPLTWRLLYEDLTLCPDQSILVMLDDSRKTKINSATGMSEARLKITEVSRNHQHKKFVIQVIPDVAMEPLTADVGGVLSPAVNVLSKRNSKPSAASSERSSGHAAAASSSSSSSNGDGGGYGSFGGGSGADKGVSEGHDEGEDGGAGGKDAMGLARHPEEAAAALPHPEGGKDAPEALENVLAWTDHLLRANQVHMRFSRSSLPPPFK